MPHSLSSSGKKKVDCMLKKRKKATKPLGKRSFEKRKEKLERKLDERLTNKEGRSEVGVKEARKKKQKVWVQKEG